MTRKHIAGAVAALLLLACLAFVPSLTDFNNTQFGTQNNKVNIATGALMTNPIVNGALVQTNYVSQRFTTLLDGNIYSHISIGWFIDGTDYLFLDTSHFRSYTPGFISLGSSVYPWAAVFTTNWNTPTNVPISGYQIVATGAGGDTAWVQGVATSYITNLYSTSNFVSYQYVTNQYVSLSYITNLYVTTNFDTYAYITNEYVTLGYATNFYITTNFVSNSYVTNLTVINEYALSNYVQQLTVTNGISFYTNSWAGPTNTLDMSLEDQYFTASTDCSITGIVSKLSTQSSSVILTLTNSATTNITLRMAGFTSGDGSRSFVVTNAAIGVVSFKYSPVFNQTNFVERNFW